MRILIAEDEAIQRRGLEAMIREILPQAEITAVGDGLAAVSAVAIGGAPDVVFMDVRMPRLDGIAAAAKIRELAPAVTLYILTAYEQFSYAQRAVSIGADDYLLKPVAPEDLAACLEAAERARQQHLLDKQRQAELRQMLADAMPLLRSQFARDLCLGAITSQAEYRRRANLLNLDHAPDVAISIGLGAASAPAATPVPAAMAPVPGAAHEAALELLRRQLTTEVEQLAARTAPGALVARIAHDEVVILAPTKAIRAGPRSARQLLHRLAGEVLDLCRAARLGCAAGIGGPCSGPLALWRSYREAVQARGRAWLLGSPGHCLLDAADLGGQSDGWDRYPLIAERGLCGAVQGGLVDQANAYLGGLLPFFAETPDPPGPATRSRAAECLALLTRAASEGGADPDRVLDLSTAALDRVLRATAASAIAEAVAECALTLASLVSSQQDQRQSGLAARAAAYLDGHFPEPISLTAVAEELHVSPFYLSHVFRRTTGQTFSDYLTAIRVREAKRLLSVTDLSVGEVAARIGYREPNYFGRVFKKHTGLTPLAWRRGTGK